LTTSLLLLTILVVGGEGTLWGGLIGLAVLKVLPEYFSELAQYQLLITGALLTVVLLVFPAGAAGGLIRLTNWLWRRANMRPRPPAAAQPELVEVGTNGDAS
ncbi:MAG: hypothetical protein J2P20_12585, partial [Pseudonocardia sp.]|nr:hypothetical protein [Pseudonocardia sp.]